MSNDRISRYRVARLSLFPPQRVGGNYRYAITASVIRNGVPSAQIIADGIIRGGQQFPTHEEILEAMDAAIRQHMLGGR